MEEQVPLQRQDAERILEREDLDADELGQHRVDAEERGQRDEQPRGAVVAEAVHAMSAVIQSAARDLRRDTGRSLAALGVAGALVTAVRRSEERSVGEEVVSRW